MRPLWLALAKAAKIRPSTDGQGCGLSSKLANGRADHEFGGKNSLTEGHLRVMQPFKKHLHTSFANLFLIDTDGRKRRVHKHSFFAVVEADQADIVRHLHSVAA